ncbi:MAG: hypothetical protein K2X80_08625 [Pseudomonadaceae bacterium]|nr:hypothetical protein [Pseudomonadaceae bacterium]
MATKQPDWEAINGLYRAGLLSVRAIAEKHGISDTAIRKQAKKLGWSRDLTDQVRAAAKAKVVRAEVRASGSQQEPRTDEQIIEEASDQAASVIFAHRTGLAQWRGIAGKLCDALDDMVVTPDNASDFARSLNAGVDAQLKVIKGERQAYNLDAIEGDKTVSDLATLMDELSKEA